MIGCFGRKTKCICNPNRNDGFPLAPSSLSALWFSFGTLSMWKYPISHSKRINTTDNLKVWRKPILRLENGLVVTSRKEVLECRQSVSVMSLGWKTTGTTKEDIGSRPRGRPRISYWEYVNCLLKDNKTRYPFNYFLINRIIFDTICKSSVIAYWYCYEKNTPSFYIR